MTKNQSIASYVAIFIVGLALGVGATYTATKQSLSTGGIDNSYQAGFEAAKQRVLESGAGMILKTPDEIRSLSGTVTEIQGNRITLHVQSVDPFADATLNDRIVTVTGDTKITKLAQKDPQTIRSEAKANAEKIDQNESQKIVEPFVETDSALSDITVGSDVNVTATDNIKTAKTFTVAEIQITR